MKDALAAMPIAVGDATFVPHFTGGLYWRERDTLIVADLHLEKASSFARRGHFLPPYDTLATLRKLETAIHTFQPQTVIALGDSFHDRGGPARISDTDRALLETLQSGRRWVWMSGNHDPDLPDHLGGERIDMLRLDRFMLRHEPSDSAEGLEIAGHLHPCARVSVKGGRFRRPCFAADARRIVMPAFGALTGGLNVLDGAFTAILDFGTIDIRAIGQFGVYPVSPDLLCPDETR